MVLKIKLIIFACLVCLIAFIYPVSAFVLDDFEDNNIFGSWNSPAGNVNWGPGSGSYPDSYVNLYEASSPVHSGSYSMRIERTGGSSPYLWIKDWEDAGISNSDLTKYSHLTMWVYDNSGTSSEFTLVHNSNSAYDQRTYTSGNGWSRLVFGFGPGYILSSNEIHIVAGSPGSTKTFYVDDIVLTNCTCSSGPCCDGCNFKDTSTVCKENITSEYNCPWGNNLGDDVGVKQSFKYCSGTSTNCNGAIGWTGWNVFDSCDANEICRAGFPSCTDPSYTCYFDSECGTDNWINQPLCQENNLYQDLHSYKCNNPGSSSSYCSDTTQATVKERCLHGCNNNSCVVSNNPPYLFSDQYIFLDDMFKQHINYFLSNQPTTSYGLPLTAYKVGDRARYGYSNPTEWGYLLQAWIAAAERGIITKEQARTKIITALSTMNALQNDPNQNYHGLFYPYYKVTNSGGNDIFPYHDIDTKIPSIDNGLLYTSLLIVEGWSYENNFNDTANLSKTIKDKMNYSIFLYESNTKISHQINAANGQLNTNNYWNIYPDEGGLMTFIMYASNGVDLQGFETLTNNQRREQREWNGYVVNESALFNAMFTWSVRSLAGFKVTNTPYSKDSFVPSVNAHLEYGDFLNINYPGFSDAMTQAYEGKSLTGVYFPPNLDNLVPSTPPTHILPHAFFVPFNALADLNQTTISLLIDKISLLKNDSENYYRNTGAYNFGFTVTASPYRNDSTFTGTDDGENVFETLSQSYIALSLFSALQKNNNSEDFYDFAVNVPGYEEKVTNALNFLYPGWHVCVDNDSDNYSQSDGDCGPVDCNDNNINIYPGATEVCNGLDDDCDGTIDENLTQTCGFGNCTGTKTCFAGFWNNCSSNGNDAGICAKCNATGIPIYDSAQNTDCNDPLYCNGIETCSAIYTCQSGNTINCSINNLNPIATCNNNPDNILLTWDYFAGFTSLCNEALDKCDNGTINLTHTCNLTCGAECVTDIDCNDNNPNTNDSCLGNCTCLHNQTMQCVVPYNNMNITGNVVFCGGIYPVYNINIINNNIIVDCNNSNLAPGWGTGTVFNVINKNNISLKNCRIGPSYLGVSLTNSSNSLLSNLSCYGTNYCIGLYSKSNNNIISDINVVKNFDNNLEILNSGYNIVKNSDLSNSEYRTSIYLSDSDSNIIENNNLSYNGFTGTWFFRGGMFLFYSDNNTIFNNTLSDNKWGGHGFYLLNSLNNLIFNNNVINNSEGFYLSSSQNNTIFLNNIKNNTIQAFDSPNSSFWDYNGKGNYWSNYDEASEGCNDLNGNGFCDSHYIIDNDSRDNYPFAKSQRSFNISLNSGWNLISIPLNITNNSIDAVFGNVMNKVIVINSFDNGALTYDPMLPEFSDLTIVDSFHGYWVKMSQSDNLSVSGTNPENKTINLVTGWNLISFMCNSSKNVNSVFSGIMNKVIVVNGFENGALTYDPLLPEFSDLQVMKPNYGYWVKMNQSAVINYDVVC